MCELFICADSELWASKTRSLRIDGVVTSVRMENFFWQVLEEIGQRDGLSCAQVISRLYLESIDAEHDLGNFTSFLRVCCGRYLSLVAEGEISAKMSDRLSAVDSPAILARERLRHKRKAHNLQAVAAR